MGNRLTQLQNGAITTYGYTPGTNRLLTISNAAGHAIVHPFTLRKPQIQAGGHFWANAPLPPLSAPVTGHPTDPPTISKLSGLLGWPMLLVGFAGIFSLRRRLRAQLLLSTFFVALLLLGSTTLLSGCVTGSTITSLTDATPKVGMTGLVRGGQQPIAGATIQLYAVGTSGDGSVATPLLTSVVQTTATGGFSIPSYTCPSASTLVYLTATGGNPGLAAGTNNKALAMMVGLGPCSSLATATYVTVNERTTVGSLAALYRYTRSVSSLGSGPLDAMQLTYAFGTVPDYTNTATGAVPGPALPSVFYASSIEINSLADAIAACINSGGGVAGDGSACGTLFALTTPPGGSAPTDTFGAMLSILNNPTRNVMAIFGLITPAAPFQPSLPTPPANWSLPIVGFPVAPSFSLADGTYAAPQTLTLISATGTTIYYTTDGTTPTTASHQYTGPITVSSTEIVAAVAALNPYVASPIGAAFYTIGSGGGPSSGIAVVTNANGNITSIPPANSTAYATFNYNNANRLASVTGSPMAATFVYDWQGQRFSKTDGGTPATIYTYGQDGAVIAENDGGAVTDYVYADGRPIAVLQPSATPVANQVSYVMADRLGTPQRLTNGGGTTVWSTAYHPFGTTGTINATVNQNLRFPGQLADAETGFYYNLNRDYMPNLGRYLESDRVGLVGGPNTYQYAGANPVRTTDHSGLVGEEILEEELPEILSEFPAIQQELKTAQDALEDDLQALKNEMLGEGQPPSQQCPPNLSSKYDYSIKKPRSVPNAQLEETTESFEKGLDEAGFIRGSTNDGLTTYTKGNTQYTIYPESTSSGVPSVQVKVGGQKTVKLRLAN